MLKINHHVFKLFMLIVGSISLLSAQQNSERIDIKAKYIDFTDGIVKAKENVIVYRDGKVIKFILDNPLVEITPSADNLPNFYHGRIRNILLEYKKDIFPARVEIKMDLSPWLKYNREPSQNGIPFWRISFRHKGTMSGIGKTGYIIQISEDKVNNSHYQHNPHFRKKIDW